MASFRLREESEDLGDGVVAEINITPLTDIFLVLLIIFMVTSSAIVDAGGQAGVEVDLPKGGASEIAGTRPELVVAILEDGRSVMGGRVQSVEELKESFAQARASAPETTVIVQADRGVAHGRVVEVMELARAAGLAHLAIATQPVGMGE